jgi:hypothetical protein
VDNNQLIWLLVNCQVNRERSYKIRLADRSAYDRDRSWYGLTHTLRVWDVLSNTQYNTSTIVHGEDHECS